MRTKMDRGMEEAYLYVDNLFDVVSGGEKRAFKSRFIVIFLFYRLKDKEANKKEV